jgi:hypothetical protein
MVVMLIDCVHIGLIQSLVLWGQVLPQLGHSSLTLSPDADVGAGSAGGPRRVSFQRGPIEYQ